MRGSFFILAAISMALSACASDIQTVKLDGGSVQHLAPNSFALVPVANGATPGEVALAQRIVTDRFTAHGFSISATPYYLIDVAISARAGAVGVYQGGDTSQRNDPALPNKQLLGPCAGTLARVFITVTERDNGAVLTAVRSGQTQCGAGEATSLTALIDAALGDIL